MEGVAGFIPNAGSKGRKPSMGSLLVRRRNRRAVANVKVIHSEPVKPRKFVPSEADDGNPWECRAVLLPVKASVVGVGTEHKQPTDSP